MPAGQKDAIMTALGNLTVSVTHNSQTYAIKGITPESARFSVVRDTPIRVISPVVDVADNLQWLTLNAGMGRSVYRITDLLLFRESVAGSGIETDGAWLVKYQREYVYQILKNRTLGLSGVVISEIASIEAGVYPYPIQSAQVYNGVKAELIVNEVVIA